MASADVLARPSVMPSGADFASRVTPRIEPAPPTFSTTKGLPSLTCKWLETMRAKMSAVPPAAKGTITVTCLDG